jgi:hypothetical protein
VIDGRELCRRMDVDVRRCARPETTHRSIPDRLRSTASRNDTGAEFDQMIGRVDAECACAQARRALARLPCGSAASCIAAQSRLRPAERMAGRRWIQVARKRRGPGVGLRLIEPGESEDDQPRG